MCIKFSPFFQLSLSLSSLPNPQDQPGGGGRFAASYKKQFREQEARSLAARTAGCPPECACLVALDASTSAVLGALDVRPPASAGGLHPRGVPASDATGAAVLNVAVAPAARRKGVGVTLMAAAADLARASWAADRLYASVAAANKPARALYAACGYKAVEGDVGAECDVAGGLAGAETLGEQKKRDGEKTRASGIFPSFLFSPLSPRTSRPSFYLQAKKFCCARTVRGRRGSERRHRERERLE